MRGSLQPRQARRYTGGIIPADAGLTTPPAIMMLSARDHPRGCGAHPRFEIRGQLAEGSSPRMRGSRTFEQAAYSEEGIIPADAGLTLSFLPAM